jgi:tryptophan synthase alpha chain
MRIRKLLNQYIAEGKKAFIPFIMAGDHDIATTERLIIGLEEAGADIIELGIPFSDPIADGATIIMAGMRALEHHVTLKDCISLVKRVRGTGCTVPILLFSYYNPILALGHEEFIRLAKDAYIDGVIVVDLPEDEGREFITALKASNIGTVMLASPTTTRERIISNASASSEFLYYISRIGTTGIKSDISITLEQEVKAIQTYINIPIAVGFGISSISQAKEIAAIADAVIVGSSLVKEMEELDTMLAINNLLIKAKALARAIKGEER